MVRGGKRTGSGRPVVSPMEKRVQVCISVSQETKRKIKAYEEAQEMKIGRWLDKYIDRLDELSDEEKRNI